MYYSEDHTELGFLSAKSRKKIKAVSRFDPTEEDRPKPPPNPSPGGPTVEEWIAKYSKDKNFLPAITNFLSVVTKYESGGGFPDIGINTTTGDQRTGTKATAAQDAQMKRMSQFIEDQKKSMLAMMPYQKGRPKGGGDALGEGIWSAAAVIPSKFLSPGDIYQRRLDIYNRMLVERNNALNKTKDEIAKLANDLFISFIRKRAEAADAASKAKLEKQRIDQQKKDLDRWAKSVNRKGNIFQAPSPYPKVDMPQPFDPSGKSQSQKEWDAILKRMEEDRLKALALTHTPISYGGGIDPTGSVTPADIKPEAPTDQFPVTPQPPPWQPPPNMAGLNEVKPATWLLLGGLALYCLLKRK